MAKSWTVFTTILLTAVFSGCATKVIYKCPIELLKEWESPPDGTFIYQDLRPAAFDCDEETKMCNIHLDDVSAMINNMLTCESARTNMLEYMKALRE